MTRFTRRRFLGGVGALCLAGVERASADFTSALRLPGASGLWGVLKATEVREIRVRRTELAVLPGLASPFWAYAVESDGKRFLNPTLVARRGDGVRVRMANELDQAACTPRA